MTYRFLSPALLELSKAADDYEEAVPGLGGDFIEEVDTTIAEFFAIRGGRNLRRRSDAVESGGFSTSSYTGSWQTKF
jgi:hypothetical protein